MIDPSIYDERTYQTEDGLTLYYRAYAPPQAPADSHPVVCLPGLTRNCKDFETLAAHLRKWGHRVLSPDLRGRGRSDYDTTPENYAPGTYVKDVLTLLQVEQATQAVIIGTSLGGIIAMVMARACPHVLAGVVLNDIGAEIDPTGIARITSMVGQTPVFTSWDEAAAALAEANAAIYPTFTPEDWMAVARCTYREREDGRICADYDPAIAAPFIKANDPNTSSDMWPFFEALAEIPTLVVRGAISDILSAETMAAMKARKPDLECLEVADRGHIPLLTEPECLDALHPFLRRTAGLAAAGGAS